MKIFSLIFLILFAFPTLGQIPGMGITDIEDDDLNVGGDIFTDFNEEVEEAQVLEDERYYRYGRFFSFMIGLGVSEFTGNRGAAYDNDGPTFGLGFLYFADFQSAMGLGLEYSKHTMFFGEPTFLFAKAAGFIEVKMLRVYFSYRYYIDTADLGTAITYANPYFIGRMEYWYQTNKLVDQSGIPDDSGGGFGFGGGFGLEFPIELKESFVNVEFLYHSVNFFDKNTQSFAPVEENGVGFEDLAGNVITVMVRYVISW
jgi:hypothetical protein